MRRSVLAVFAVLFLSLVSAHAGVRPRIGPPPPRAELNTVRPSPKHVWIAGHWKWAGSNYVWINGRWVKGRPGNTWVPGSWVQKGTYWVWTSGHWKKTGTGGPKPAKK